MKAIRLKIIDLLDQHAGSVHSCKGCETCAEIERLGRSFDRDPAEKERCKSILAKGKDMNKSDLVFLIETEVDRKTIKKALGMNKTDYYKLLENWGLIKFRRKKEEEEVPRETKLTVEEYMDLKAKGLKDKDIAQRKGMKPQSLSQWKWANQIKVLEGTKTSKKPTPKTETPKEDTTAEMRQLINDLSDSNKEKDKTIQELESKVQELENLNAACSDVENESSSLQEELAKVKEKADGYLHQLLDTRDELIKKDYLVENQTKALENLRITLERYETENRALRDLVRVWV